jgi:hypothetical protein
LRGECAADEVPGGAVRSALEEVAGSLPLGQLPGEARSVDVGAEALAGLSAMTCISQRTVLLRAV